MFPANAQIHELGFFAGGSNTIADIGPTNFIYANSPVFGLIYKWNITTRYAIRGSFMRSTLKNNDVYSSDLSRFRRFLNVENTINEFSLGFEVNFFDFNLHNDDKVFSPYFFSGINYFSYDLLHVPLTPGDDVIQKYDGAMEISIPAVVGVKASISPLFVLSLETGIRYALTDNLDGSKVRYKQLQKFISYMPTYLKKLGIKYTFKIVIVEQNNKKCDNSSSNSSQKSQNKSKSVKQEETTFPQFSLNVSNPISWKLMLLIMVMQLLTNIMLVVVLYLK